MNSYDEFMILQYSKQPNVLFRLNFPKISCEIEEIKILMRLQGFVVNCGTAFRFGKRSIRIWNSGVMGAISET